MRQWADSNRRAELPTNWDQLRKECKARAHGKCQWPGCRRWGSECDHIGDKMDHSSANLQWLCKGHHRFKTERDRRKTKPVRQPERHPGEIRRRA